MMSEFNFKFTSFSLSITKMFRNGVFTMHYLTDPGKHKLKKTYFFFLGKRYHLRLPYYKKITLNLTESIHSESKEYIFGYKNISKQRSALKNKYELNRLLSTHTTHSN